MLASPAERSVCCNALARCHNSGSVTLRLTQMVKNAGSTPTKNTARQPQVGSTIQVTMAAAA